MAIECPHLRTRVGHSAKGSIWRPKKCTHCGKVVSWVLKSNTTRKLSSAVAEVRS